MQQLNYLKQDEKVPGRESFVTYVDFQVQDGSADMWLYDIFPGVQLMVADFATESCFRDGEKQNVIGINHCRKGRFECVFDNKNYLYLGEGDIALNSQMHPPIASSFPLNYYYGSTIIMYMLFFFTEKSNITSFLRVALKKLARKLVRKKVKKFAFDHCKTCSERFVI